MNKQNTMRFLKAQVHYIVSGVFLLAVMLVWAIGWNVFGARTGGTALFPSPSEASAIPEELVNPFSDPAAYPSVVMIDNAPEARPFHSGFSDALVVYEALVEGGATRFALVFSGGTEAPQIGPVRSARPYFVDMAADWKALYVHAGGSPEGLARIDETAVVDLNEISGLGIKYFWRDHTIARPHNLFTSGALIAKGVEDFELNASQASIPMQWGTRADQDSPASSTASELYIDFSPGTLFDASYIYDAENGTYLRSMAGAPHKDYNTKKQISASTVVIQKTPTETYLPSGYERIGIDMSAGGEALYFTEGKEYAGSWRINKETGVTEWLDAEGRPFLFAPGTVWLTVLPGSREVRVQ